MAPAADCSQMAPAVDGLAVHSSKKICSAFCRVARIPHNPRFSLAAVLGEPVKVRLTFYVHADCAKVCQSRLLRRKSLGTLACLPKFKNAPGIADAQNMIQWESACTQRLCSSRASHGTSMHSNTIPRHVYAF